MCLSLSLLKKELSTLPACVISFDFDSLASAIDDSEVLVDVAVAVDASLKFVEDVFAVDELAKDSLVAVKEGSLIEGDREFRSSCVGTGVRSSQLTPLDVSHCKVFVTETSSVLAHIFVSETSARDSQTVLTVVELSVCEGGASFGVSVAEGLEVFGGVWLAVRVQFKDKFSKFFFAASHGQVNLGVGRVGVGVSRGGESSLAQVQQTS